MKQWRKVAVMAISCLVFMGLLTNSVAAQYSSTHYETNEVFFGSGGQLCNYGTTGYSTNYCAQSAVGELGVGDSTSNNYQIHAGFNTTQQPFLQFIVTGSNINLGYLSTSAATTATATFTVSAWDSTGYIVVNASPPPTNSESPFHTMTNLTSPTLSSPGTEQFGINLEANTSPSIAGSAPPQQLPNSSFSFGQAATGYNNGNYFKYVNGDTIAYSTQSTSITDYTVSYLFNISTATPAGQYNFTHTLVATGTY
jgi:hypothetical protein